ncbi:hypothetical protein E5343_03400 [Rodentibacter caecimuris]|nr:hypothetical protein AC062_1783 [Pasteurellaceae bacterium NI1060]TGY50702.1 hypothetical protein E5343_03400 [Pasteurella caecimuris]
MSAIFADFKILLKLNWKNSTNFIIFSKIANVCLKSAVQYAPIFYRNKKGITHDTTKPKSEKNLLR